MSSQLRLERGARQRANSDRTQCPPAPVDVPTTSKNHPAPGQASPVSRPGAVGRRGMSA